MTTPSHKPGWARQLQTDPPNFGQAKRVPRWRLNWDVARRRPRCQAVLRSHEWDGEFERGLVSVIVLSCQRLPQLRRLCESLVPFLRDVETYARRETILIDNGSGPELIAYAEGLGFFDRIIAHPVNLGMLEALRHGFAAARGEYLLLVEDDFVLHYDQPFLARCLELFDDYPEIGIIRLKNQNNWWKPSRRIAPLRTTRSGTRFWTWLPSRDGMANVWASGSVLFRKVSYCSTGPLPEGPNLTRDHLTHQGHLYECVYGRRYNRTWLAAKIDQCCPFIQPNDHADCPGWGQQPQAAVTEGVPR